MMEALALYLATGAAAGLLAGMLGVGGGTLSVPFMVYCNRGMREAVGTSAAVGLPIAVFGSLGYLVSGLGAAGLPAYSLGFVHLPALASMFTAPWGARAAHRLPVPLLKKLFALLLYLLGAKMAFSLF